MLLPPALGRGALALSHGQLFEIDSVYVFVKFRFRYLALFVKQKHLAELGFAFCGHF